MRRVYLNTTVLEEAKKRIRWVYQEFDNVVVNTSGGKDSTVVLHLALEVAREMGRLPVNVMFIDQEAEWQSVIDYIRSIMNNPDVKPYWLQVPMRISNATTTDPAHAWLQCWEEGAEWIRPKEPNSIHENLMGTPTFGEIFQEFAAVYFKGSVASLGGVRTEESPARLSSITGYECYKGVCWGNKKGAKRNIYTFYPIYDWSLSDVWKAIHEHKWPYCKLYDLMYQHGVPLNNMRVSNVHHETAVHVLAFLQEIEPQTWNKIITRVSGAHSVKQLGAAYQVPADLPPMFSCWEEYRDYLVDTLIEREDHRAIFHRRFAKEDDRYLPSIKMKLIKYQIGSVLVNDYHGAKASTFSAAFNRHSKTFGVNRIWTDKPQTSSLTSEEP